MRKEIIANKELREHLEEKSKIVEEGRKISSQIDKLTEKRNKLGIKVQKLKDKIIPLFEKEVEPKLKLEEFEEISSFELQDQKIHITIVDRVEEYKEFYRGEKKKIADQNANEKGTGDVVSK